MQNIVEDLKEFLQQDDRRVVDGKLIYMIPPYNTGNESYNYTDRFNFLAGLTFMKNRLDVAKELLSADGSIWVSLDDIDYSNNNDDKLLNQNLNRSSIK
jgi:hypothetical protein